MEWNEVLLWIVGASCASLILGVARRRSAAGEVKGWLIAIACVIAGAAVTWRWRPEFAGFVAAILWAALLVIPSLAMRQSRTLTARLRFAQAARIAALARWLHPFDGWWALPKLLRAQHLHDAGRSAEAEALLEPLTHHRGSVGRAATVHLFRMRDQWPEIAHWIEQAVPLEKLRLDSAMIAVYVRALGETGRLADMVDAHARLHRAMDGPVHAANRNLARACLFAFAGRPSEVQAVFDGPLAPMPAPVKRFWIGTANLAAGNRELAESQLTFGDEASPAVRRAAARRLNTPLADPNAALDAPRLDVLRATDLDRAHEQRYQAFTTTRTRPLVTRLLVAANLATFALEMLAGGSMREPVLMRLGAAQADAVLHLQQWWRLLAANFLHFGPLHLAMNMAALWVLGPFVEAALGRWRYLAVYLLSGIAGVGFVVWRNAARATPIWWPGQPIPPQFETLVGASAAIMGLVGATGAILLAGWWRERARAARQGFLRVLFAVGLQVLFDSQMKQVSGAAHLGGLFAGAAITLPLVLLRRARVPVPAAA